MATDLFHVTVSKLTKTQAELTLRIITGEQPEFYSGKTFALMLLYDPIVEGMVTDAPLASHISFEQVIDSEWLFDHVDDYVLAGLLKDVQNYPFVADLESMSAKERRDFFRSNRTPSARFEIFVTEPEWLSHLREGMEWNSAAFDAQS